MRFCIFLSLIFVVSCAPLPGSPPDPDTAVTSPPVNAMTTADPPVSPFLPKPGDEKLIRGQVFLTETGLVIRESYPPQVSVSLGGNLPTPCHELRAEIAAPDAENKIAVNAYSLIDPEAVCIQVLEPFQAYLDLGTFPAGHYSVWVNGELAGEFDT